MNVDSYFTVGKGHAVCQDYALAKMYNPPGSPPWLQRPYLIVSDGCSSSPQTDVGARILAHMAEKQIRKSYEINSTLSWEDFGLLTIAQAQACTNIMGLPTQCLDATLLVGFESTNNVLTIYMYGDGYILGVSSDEEKAELSCTTVKYDHSAPYYLTYLIDSHRRAAYQNQNIRRHQISGWMGDSIKQQLKQYPEDSNIFFRSYDKYKYIALGSDGLGAFTDSQTGKSYEDHMVMDSFLSFKNTKGEFVKRRVKRAMRDLEREQHIIPGDDVSIAVLEV